MAEAIGEKAATIMEESIDLVDHIDGLVKASEAAGNVRH